MFYISNPQTVGKQPGESFYMSKTSVSFGLFIPLEDLVVVILSMQNPRTSALHFKAI